MIRRISGQNISPETLFFVGFALAIPGLVYSRALLSIGMVVIVLSSLLLGNYKPRFLAILRHPVVILFMLLFAVIAISGLYSHNMAYFMERLRIKLPFALLPLAILSFPSISKQRYHQLLYLFFLNMLGLALYGTVRLCMDYAHIVQSFTQAGALPMPISHIQMSLMMALAVVAGGYLYLQKFQLRYDSEKYFLLVGVFFLFIFLHLAAVRSGLLAMYLMLLVFGLQYVVITHRYWLGLVVLSVVILLPFAAFHYVPTFKNKVDYMCYDVGRFMGGELTGAYSDTRRLTSIQLGIKVGNTCPIYGVGYGDVPDRTNQLYHQYYPQIAVTDYLSPHNQFVYVYAGVGMVGLLVFCAAIIWPIFYLRAWQHPMLLAVNITLISSFITEHTLEVQIGTALYLILLLLAMNYWQGFAKISKAY